MQRKNIEKQRAIVFYIKENEQHLFLKINKRKYIMPPPCLKQNPLVF
jgi:hypothetical protein